MTTHPIPMAALDQHVLVVGKTGSGKSYLGRGMVERLLAEGRRVCILDYTGVWWGLRSSASGEKAGRQVVLFGGEHADVVINEHAGHQLAQFVAESDVATVIDLDGMTVAAQQRMVRAFLEELYRRNKRPLHLVLEELDEFAPLHGAPGSEPVIGAVCRIFQRGRRKGFRAIAITQRPANLHTRVRSQCASLVAMKLMSPQDRKAIEDWIRGQADVEKGREVVDSLPKLQLGEGWLWCPDAGLLRREKFPPIATFDSMRAPEDEADARPMGWAAVDLDGVRARLAEAVQEAEANDPAKLKARVAELERRLRTVPKPAVDQAAIDRAVASAVAAKDRRWKQALDLANSTIADLTRRLSKIRDACPVENETVHVAPPIDLPAAAAPTPAATAPPPRNFFLNEAHTSRHEAKGGGSCALPEGERIVLTAIAQSEDGVTREELGILTQYKRSTRDSYIARLGAKGLVEVGAHVVATDAGIEALGADFTPLPTGDALLSHWLRTLPDGERRVLEVVAGRWPGAVDAAAIDEATGYKRSTRDSYIARLSVRRLVTRQRGGVKASDLLFDAGGAA